MSRVRAAERRYLAPLTLSAVLHAALMALAVSSLREPRAVALPPMYRVEIIAAPAGERAIGEVRNREPDPKKAVTAPTAAQPTVKEMPLPRASTALSAPPRATPNESKTPAKAKSNAPKAGGGPVGGKGTDVATVRSEGIEFPFPGYLNNIVRQIALNFKPRNPSVRLKAEVAFLIHRDGSVSEFRFLTRSGAFAFDLEAQGAVEAAAAARSFGPLPAGFRDDVLPVVFSFDPEFLK